MTTKRTSDSAMRVLRVLMALKGKTLEGISNGDLAKNLGESAPTINRCLNTLIEAGLARKLENGRFGPGIALLQIAQAHANEMASMQDRLNEISQRVLAGSRTL